MSPMKVKVKGTRTYMLWLLVAIVLGITALIALGVFVISPAIQRQQAQQTALAEAEKHYLAGAAFQDAQDWQSAEEEFRQVILAAPDYEDATDRLRQVLEKQRSIQSTSTAVALVLIEQERQDAQSTATAQVEATLRVIETHYQKGLGYIMAAQWNEAKTELEMVFDLDPSYKDIQERLAEASNAIATLNAPTITPTPTLTPSPTRTPTSTPTLEPDSEAALAATEAAATTTVIETPAGDAAPSSAGVLFEDNFDNGIDPEWQFNEEDWISVNGQLTSLNGNSSKVMLLGEPSWSNYAIEADFWVNDWNNYNMYAGFIVRAQDMGKFISMNFRSYGNKDVYWLISGVGDNEIVLDEKGLWGQGDFIDKKHHVRIEVRGNDLAAYMDEMLISRVTYTKIPASGMVGIRVASEQTVFIDNFIVMPLP